MVVSAGKRIIADILDQGTYVPALTAATTNPTLGSGSSQTGWWKRVDDLIIGGGQIKFGTSGVAAGSGTYYVSLPFLVSSTFMIASSSTAGGHAVGLIWMRDNSAPAADGGLMQIDGTADKCFMEDMTTGGIVNNAAPWIWAASDVINFNFFYQADPSVL